jgi:hypothetical protein
MTYVQILLSNLMIRLCLVTGLFLWGFTATIYAISKEEKTVLIGIDENGTRIIENTDDPLLKTEIVAFLRHFTLLMYNFDQQTYLENVGSASELMSENLWGELKEALRSKQSIVKEHNVSHTGIVEKIIKVDSSQFEVVVRGFEQRKIKRVERLFKIQVSLRAQDRNQINPWGVEVDGLKEIPLN